MQPMQPPWILPWNRVKKRFNKRGKMASKCMQWVDVSCACSTRPLRTSTPDQCSIPLSTIIQFRRNVYEYSTTKTPPITSICKVNANVSRSVAPQVCSILHRKRILFSKRLATPTHYLVGALEQPCTYFTCFSLVKKSYLLKLVVHTWD